MSNKRKFKCKSEEQKRAIRANYARMAKKAKENKVERDKNSSCIKGVRLGMTLSTYDEYLPHKNQLKENKERPVVVIEKNDENELAVVPLSTRKGRNRTHLPNYQQGQSYFKHFVEVEDNEGNSIVLGAKFRGNSPNQDVSLRDVEKIKEKVFENSAPAAENKKKIEKFRKK